MFSQIVFLFYCTTLDPHVPCGGHDVAHIADTLHLLLRELPGAEAVLAPAGPEHLLVDGVGRRDLHGGHHLPPVRRDLLELLAHLKLALSRLDETLGLHAPDVSLLADGDEWLALVAELPHQVTNAQRPHELVKVLALSQLVLANNNKIIFIFRKYFSSECFLRVVSTLTPRARPIR